VKRTESLLTVGVMIALLAVLAIGPGAQGKGRGKGGSAVVTSTKQSAILDAGAVTVNGGKGKVTIRATAGTQVLGKVGGYKAKQGSSGRPKSAAAAKVHTAKLTAGGKTILSGCAADGLSAQAKFRKGRKKVTRTTTTPLDTDLAICSKGSEHPAARPYKGPAIDTSNSDRCDFMDPAVCMQPWPNDYFTVADGSTDTGRRLNLNQQSMPKNKNGTPINNTDYNRADGFSPGNMIIVKIPQVQTQAAFNNSGIVPITNLHKYDDEGQAVVVIDADTGERHPIWAEIDANPLQPAIPGVTEGGSGNPADSNLIIRPAVNWEEGHRYIVAIRNLRDGSNNPVEAPMPFRVYRDNLTTSQAAVEARRPHLESLFSTLQGNGYQRSNLYMTWDFTVASQDSLTGRAVAMRDDALLRLGDTTPGDPIDGDETGDDTPGDGSVDGAAPTFQVTGTSDPDGPGGNVLRQVDGVLTNVPCYLDDPGCPPVSSDFSFAPGADDPTLEPASFAADEGAAGVKFRCIIPNAVDAGTTVAPARPGTYGHGLLGQYTQVNGQARLGNESDSIWCATDWAGFSEADTQAVSNSLVDLSNFRQLVDRMQQGFVNFLYLGRALANPNGFNTDPAFQIDPDDGGSEPMTPVIDNSHLYYEGISQGAIMGGALTALSPDFTRSVLDVTAMNYSNLLRRSVDFDEYAELPSVGLYAFYPNELERPLVLSVMQLLWDRGEANGYAHHMTDDPLPGTPPHQVLLQAAVGDHQVSNVQAEVEARTVGARIYKPALDPGRHWDVNPFMGLDAINFGPGPSSYNPYHGSALVYYDGGPTSYFNNGDPEPVIECTNNPLSTVPLMGSAQCQGSGVMPTDEVPPRPENGYGEDPHGYPRRAIDGLQHVDDFLDPNGFILPCTTGLGFARPCYANGWHGPGTP
jgi:hypothetical protein